MMNNDNSNQAKTVHNIFSLTAVLHRVIKHIKTPQRNTNAHRKETKKN